MFGNSNFNGCNSVYYFLDNHNAGTGFNGTISIKSVFDDLGYTHIYEKYKDQLTDLEQEHNNLSKYGQMLLFAIPKDTIKDCVYLSKSGGSKERVFIDGVGNTDNINIIMETLNNNPEKIANTDNLEFVLVKTWDFALDPEKSGIKVFPFNATDADSEKVKAFRAKEDELFQKIKQDITKDDSFDQMPDDLLSYFE